MKHQFIITEFETLSTRLTLLVLFANSYVIVHEIQNLTFKNIGNNLFLKIKISFKITDELIIEEIQHHCLQRN